MSKTTEDADGIMLGSIGNVADRYRTDGAAIWAWIVSERVLTNPSGERVQLVARPEERIGGTLWQVRELPAYE